MYFNLKLDNSAGYIFFAYLPTSIFMLFLSFTQLLFNAIRWLMCGILSGHISPNKIYDIYDTMQIY